VVCVAGTASQPSRSMHGTCLGDNIHTVHVNVRDKQSVQQHLIEWCIYKQPTLLDHLRHDMSFELADHNLLDLLRVQQLMTDLTIMRSHACSCAMLHAAAA
jgi:hypothetical protein